ncbi:uncharacterized protein LOC130990864 [Salvia miltiorrhiza]|uniref:uncharacterized protein LOC130990864 n=1 Tax=Salvia miltiorrhiza TaxID=226208 RepID=UPI0025AD8FFB|nr:uncharacterized protein LOC130990864 [Salvia miltiorrhiza]
MAEAEQAQTLKQLAYPTNLNLRPNEITLPENPFASRRYDLKPSLLQILPKFNGYPGDDPHTHLQDFEMTIMHQSRHQSENCPNFGEDIVDVNAIGGHDGNPHKYDPFSNTYNSGWRDHPNFRWKQDGQPQQQNNMGVPMQRPQYNQNQHQQQYQLGPPQHHNQNQQQPPYQPPHRRAPWEEAIENMVKESEKFCNEIRAGMNQTNQQISHLTKAVAKLEENTGKLPAMGINPREHAQVVLTEFPEGEEKEEELLAEAELIQRNLSKSGEGLAAEQAGGSNLTDAPYPGRLRQKAKENEASEMMKMFQKMELSIPLLDAIRQIPKYAKFLKDLCSRKVKMEEEVRYVMGESDSAVIQRKLPTKRKDLGMFTILCNIGGANMDKAMMDLGASINVMPLAVYKRLNIGEMRNTRVVIQLADRSNAYPEGVVEDVLIKVGDLIFPADFYVLDTGPENGENAILLGRPFMMTAGTKIDMKTGILTCEFDGVQEEFNIYETMKRKQAMETVDMIDVFEPLVQELGNWFRFQGHHRESNSVWSDRSRCRAYGG